MDSLRTLPSLVTNTHQARLAYDYVRQSSLGQITRHGESTDLQYRLVERAAALGWPRDRVQIIDEDRGRSGASAEQRTGFQHLIAELSLARVGIVLSWDASRLRPQQPGLVSTARTLRALRHPPRGRGTAV